MRRSALDGENEKLVTNTIYNDVNRHRDKTIIMITHRRGTMAAADRLYGVTMPEHGISKVLMLNINDISKKEGEDWDGIFG